MRTMVDRKRPTRQSDCLATEKQTMLQHRPVGHAATAWLRKWLIFDNGNN